jgi:hypothetical protein
MIIPSTRLRGLVLLGLTFAVGGVAGAAADRAWVRSRPEPRQLETRVAGLRTGPEAIESDRIPYPLEKLDLSPQETAQLHEIARRWRPQAAQAMENIRANVSDLENNMFAEMLCVISREKQERYLAQLQENNANRILIDKRFSLVRSNRCGEVRR